MKDRQPLNPGQITITLDAASATLLGVPAGTTLGGIMARNDNPVVDGDPINKNTLLKDATAKMLGGDPDTMLPDDAIQMLAALASGGGGSGDAGELEDTTMEVGSFTNAGAGWNTFTFREAFEAPPNVVTTLEEFDGVVQIKSVTAEGFLYCLRTNSSSSATTATAVVVHYVAVEYGGER